MWWGGLRWGGVNGAWRAWVGWGQDGVVCGVGQDRFGIADCPLPAAGYYLLMSSPLRRNTRPIMCNTDFEVGNGGRYLRHGSQPEEVSTTFHYLLVTTCLPSGGVSALGWERWGGGCGSAYDRVRQEAEHAKQATSSLTGKKWDHKRNPCKLYCSSDCNLFFTARAHVARIALI